MLTSALLQKFQKDAIYRQMLEYKREKATFESQLKDTRKKVIDHDDHLRVIDAWWMQVWATTKLHWYILTCTAA
jgi:E3 ubiquitin-protein ligase BRE1